MPFVPAANVAMVELRMIFAGQKVENTLYFENLSTWSPTSLTALATALEGWWRDNYAPLTSDTVRLNEIAATDLTTATSSAIILPALSDSVGEQITGALPNNVSLCVSFRTALRGRSFRGRNYFVGLNIGQYDGNSVLVTTVGAIQDAYSLLLPSGGVVPSGVNWVVLSRFSGMSGTPPEPTPRPAGVTEPVTAVQIVDPTIDSMRRRLPGRGT